MDSNKRRSLLEASSLHNAPPLALYDLLDQKQNPHFPLYSYYLEMTSSSSTKDAVEHAEEAPQTPHVEQNVPTPQPASNGSQKGPRREDRGTLPKNPGGDDDKPQKQGAKSESSSQQEFYSPISVRVKGRTRQIHLYRQDLGQTGRTRANEVVLAWSAIVADHGDDTYCGCGDTPIVWPEPQDTTASKTRQRARTLKRSVKGLAGGSKSSPATPRRKSEDVIGRRAPPEESPRTSKAIYVTAPSSPALATPAAEDPLCQHCNRRMRPPSPPPPEEIESPKRISARLSGYWKVLLSGLTGNKKESRSRPQPQPQPQGATTPGHEPASRTCPPEEASVGSFRTAMEGGPDDDDDIDLDHLDSLSADKNSPEARSRERLCRAMKLLDKSHPPGKNDNKETPAGR